MLATKLCSVLSTTLSLSCLALAVPEQYLTVTGSGTVIIMSEFVKVQAVVEKFATKAKRAQDGTSETVGAILQILRGGQQGVTVSNITVTGASLEPFYNITSDTSQLLGFFSRSVVAYTVDVDNAGDSLDQLIEAGVTRIDSVSSAPREELVRQAYSSALWKAIQDAKNQAALMARALEICLDGPASAMVGAAQGSSQEFASVVIPGGDMVFASAVVNFSHRPCA